MPEDLVLFPPPPPPPTWLEAPSPIPTHSFKLQPSSDTIAPLITS